MSKTEHVAIYIVLILGMVFSAWLGYAIHQPIIDCGL